MTGGEVVFIFNASRVSFAADEKWREDRERGNELCIYIKI